MARIEREAERNNLDPLVRVELERRETADSRDVLVLFAHRLAEHIDFDVTGLRGKLGVADEFVLVGPQGFEHTDGKRSGRSEPGAGRDVGHRRDLDPSFDTGDLQTRAQ